MSTDLYRRYRMSETNIRSFHPGIFEDMKNILELGKTTCKVCGDEFPYLVADFGDLKPLYCNDCVFFMEMMDERAVLINLRNSLNMTDEDPEKKYAFQFTHREIECLTLLLDQELDTNTVELYSMRSRVITDQVAKWGMNMVDNSYICADCGTMVDQPTHTHINIKGELVCSDCYFKKE